MQAEAGFSNRLGPGGFVVVCLATAVAQVNRTLAYTIEVIRWPLFPFFYFVTLFLTYRAAERATVEGVSPEAFLLVGTFGMLLWSSSIWTSGYAVEIERSEGTINSLFLTPASRSAVVIGYGVGSMFIFVLPSTLIVGVLAVLLGATFHVTDPLAVALSTVTLVAGSLALGYVLAGAFVLTRRANMFANFVQSPIFLLSGMVVPVDDLPSFLQWFAYVFPISSGMAALRDALLSGATLAEIAGPLTRFTLATAVLLVVGHILLRRVENVAKRGGQFDFD